VILPIDSTIFAQPHLELNKDERQIVAQRLLRQWKRALQKQMRLLLKVGMVVLALRDEERANRYTQYG